MLLTDVGFDLRDGVPYNNTCEEYCGLYLCLEDMGHEPWIVVNDRSVRGGRYRVVARDDVVPDQFDEAVINRELPNFYGGDVQPQQHFTFTFLMNFKGRVHYYACDPDVPEPGNIGGYMKQVYHKIFDLNSLRTFNMKPMSLEEIRAMYGEEKMRAARDKTERINMGIFTPYPISRHPLNKRFPERPVFVDTWRKSLREVRRLPEPNPLFPDEGVCSTSLETAPCYVGTNKPSRHNRLEEIGAFSAGAERAGLVKLYGKIAKPYKTEELGRMGVDAMTSLYLRYRLHLVVSHKKQADAGINHRYLMALAMNRVPLMDASLDSIGAVCVDPFLRENASFSNAETYARAVRYFEDPREWPLAAAAVEREAERAFGETASDLVERAEMAYERVKGSK